MLTDERGNLGWRHEGYALSYQMGETNHCPGCGRHNWLVGRLMAECAFCGTALTLMHVHGYGATQRFNSYATGDDTPPELRAVA